MPQNDRSHSKLLILLNGKYDLECMVHTYIWNERFQEINENWR